MPVVLRPATHTDLPVILAFVRELADYSRAPDAVIATDEHIAEALFGPAPSVHALIAETEGQIVSVATYFFTFSTWLGRPSLYLEDFLVNHDVRGTGVGQQMMARLAQIAIERGCGRMEWGVYDWNTSAIGFYTKLGAVPQTDLTVYRVAGDSLTTLAQTSHD